MTAERRRLAAALQSRPRRNRCECAEQGGKREGGEDGRETGRVASPKRLLISATVLGIGFPAFFLFDSSASTVFMVLNFVMHSSTCGVTQGSFSPGNQSTISLTGRIPAKSILCPSTPRLPLLFPVPFRDSSPPSLAPAALRLSSPDPSPPPTLRSPPSSPLLKSVALLRWRRLQPYYILTTGLASPSAPQEQNTLKNNNSPQSVREESPRHA